MLILFTAVSNEVRLWYILLLDCREVPIGKLTTSATRASGDTNPVDVRWGEKILGNDFGMINGFCTNWYLVNVLSCLLSNDDKEDGIVLGGLYTSNTLHMPSYQHYVLRQWVVSWHSS